MSFTDFTPGYIDTFQSNWYELAQQQNSALLSAVRVETQKAKTDYYRRVGKATAQVKGAKGTSTVFNGVSIDRRAVTLNSYNVSDVISSDDIVKLGGNDPSSIIVKQFAKAFAEKIDDVIINAAIGTATDGTNNYTIGAGNTIAAGTTNLTLDKLRKAKLILDANNVESERYLVVTPGALSSLLGDTTITNSLYNVVRPLVDGEIDSFMGFKFIVSTRPGLTSGTTDTCFAFTPSSVVAAFGEHPVTTITREATLQNDIVIYSEMMLGGTRMEEVDVVKILTDNTK